MASECGPLSLAQTFDPSLVEVIGCSIDWAGSLTRDTIIGYAATVMNSNPDSGAYCEVTWTLDRPGLSALPPIVAQSGSLLVVEGFQRDDFTDSRSLNNPVSDRGGVLATLEDHNDWFVRSQTVNVTEQSFTP